MELHRDFFRAIHRGAGYAEAGLVTASKFNPLCLASEAITGRDAAGHKTSRGMALLGLALGPVGKAVGHTVGAVAPEINLLPGLAKTGGVVDPRKVHFTQGSVSWFFRDGNNIGDTAQALREGVIDQLPAIRVFERDGKLFSLDNRRLLTYLSAGRNEIPFIRVSAFGHLRNTTRFEGKMPIIKFPHGFFGGGPR